MYITQFLNWFVDHGTSSKWNYVYCAITGPPLKGAIKVNVDDSSFNSPKRSGSMVSRVTTMTIDYLSSLALLESLLFLFVV
jgi:hypothetical protein